MNKKERDKAAKRRYYEKNRALVIAKSAQWKKDNRERHLEILHEYQDRNRTAVNQRNAAWRANNPERMAELVKRWQVENKEKCEEAARRFNRNHPERCDATRVRKLRAMPQWANKFFISEAYHLARLRTRLFGFEWHVDHMVPLKAKIVCGLHVEYNLQVIPGTANVKKGNRDWRDKP